jgi:MFS family permease
MAPVHAIRVGFGLFGVFWGSWAVAALDVQAFLGVSDTGIGVLVAATVIGTSVANVVGGTLTERIGVGRSLAVALALWSASVVPLAVVRSPGWWMAGFLVAVAAGGLFDVVLNIASTGALAHRPGRLLRVHAAYNSGAVVGAALTGALLAAGWSWRWSFAVVALGAAVVAVPVARRRRHGPAHVPSEHVTLRHAAVELRRSRLVPLAAVFALGAMVEGGIGTFGVLYLRDRLDVAVLAGAGAYVAGQALAAATRVALGSAAADRVLTGRGATPARVGLAVASVGLLLEAATDLAGVAAVGLAIGAVGVTAYWPLLSAIANGASDRPGLAVGGVSAAGYLGFLAGPPVVGAVADGAGLRAGVLVLAVTAAAAAAVPLRTIGRPSRRRSVTRERSPTAEPWAER